MVPFSSVLCGHFSKRWQVFSKLKKQKTYVTWCYFLQSHQINFPITVKQNLEGISRPSLLNAIKESHVAAYLTREDPTGSVGGDMEKPACDLCYTIIESNSHKRVCYLRASFQKGKCSFASIFLSAFGWLEALTAVLVHKCLLTVGWGRREHWRLAKLHIYEHLSIQGGCNKCRNILKKENILQNLIINAYFIYFLCHIRLIIVLKGWILDQTTNLYRKLQFV